LLKVQKIIDLLFLPWARAAPICGLALATLLVTVFALLIYKYTSNQAGIKMAKEKIKAHFVEVWLYIDDPLLILKAQAGIFWNGAKYLGFAMVPLAVMFFPVIIFLINCEYRFHYRPFKPGETFLFKVRFNPAFQEWKNSLVLNSDDGIEIDAPPLNIEARDSRGKEFRETDFRLKISPDGSYVRALQIRLISGKAVNYTYIFVSPGPLARLNTVESLHTWPQLWHPGYVGADPNYIEKIEISYPRANLKVFGWETWWVWPFIILMFIFAFALKPFLKVEF